MHRPIIEESEVAGTQPAGVAAVTIDRRPELETLAQHRVDNFADPALECVKIELAQRNCIICDARLSNCGINRARLSA